MPVIVHAECDVAATRGFPDHHPYRDDALAALQAQAKRDGLTLVTTTKDLARLGPAARTISAFAVNLVFEDAAALQNLLTQAIAAVRTKT